MEESLIQTKQTEPILVIEDDEVYKKMVISLLESSHLVVDSVSDGNLAVEKIKNKSYSVYIVDLILPGIQGEELIQKIKELKPSSIIIVMTSINSPEKIISIMKQGVFDFILKPIDIKLFHKTVEKAIEHRYYREQENLFNENQDKKLKQQFRWLNLSNHLVPDQGDYAKNSVYNLNTSLSQGSGLGVTITLVDLIKSSVIDNGDNTYTVDKEILDTLFENNEFSRKAIESLRQFVVLMDSPIDFDLYNATDFIYDIKDTKTKLLPFLNKKKLRIEISLIKNNCKVKINREKIISCLEELIINAYKFSVEGSIIYFFTEIVNSHLCLRVKNYFNPSYYSGIPNEMEKLVLEPFYRIHPPVEDVADLEKYNLGLGLSVVDFVVRKHNGHFTIHNSITEPNAVLAEIYLPINEFE